MLIGWLYTPSGCMLPGSQGDPQGGFQRSALKPLLWGEPSRPGFPPGETGKGEIQLPCCRRHLLARYPWMPHSRAHPRNPLRPLKSRNSQSGASGYLVAAGGEIQPAAVEVDRVDEVLLVAEAAGRVLHPLDLGVDGFASRVGDAVLEVGDDVGETAFEHAGHGFHRTQTTAHRPTVPPLEVLPRRAFIDVGVQVHGGLFQGPGAGRLQFALA